MALKSDDADIRDVRMNIILGGNGDYYITLVEIGKDMFDRKGELVKLNTLTSIRVATSGGYAPSEVKIAVAQLYRALEKHGLNEHALNDF